MADAEWRPDNGSTNPSFNILIKSFDSPSPPSLAPPQAPKPPQGHRPIPQAPQGHRPIPQHPQGHTQGPPPPPLALEHLKSYNQPDISHVPRYNPQPSPQLPQTPTEAPKVQELPDYPDYSPDLPRHKPQPKISRNFPSFNEQRPQLAHFPTQVPQALPQPQDIPQYTDYSPEVPDGYPLPQADPQLPQDTQNSHSPGPRTPQRPSSSPSYSPSKPQYPQGLSQYPNTPGAPPVVRNKHHRGLDTPQSYNPLPAPPSQVPQYSRHTSDPHSDPQSGPQHPRVSLDTSSFPSHIPPAPSYPRDFPHGQPFPRYPPNTPNDNYPSFPSHTGYPREQNNPSHTPGYDFTPGDERNTPDHLVGGAEEHTPGFPKTPDFDDFTEGQNGALEDPSTSHPRDNQNYADKTPGYIFTPGELRPGGAKKQSYTMKTPQGRANPGGEYLFTPFPEPQSPGDESGEYTPLESHKGRWKGHWQGRKSLPKDYEEVEEEVLEGVDSGDPHALLPDPTGPAVAVLERRLQHASIRHRNGRRNFIRTRKSPKMRPRSEQAQEEEERGMRSEERGREGMGEEFEVTWQEDQNRKGKGVNQGGSREHWVEQQRDEKKWITLQGRQGEEWLIQEERGGLSDNQEEEVESTASTFPWSSGAPNLENKFRAMGDLGPTGEADIGLDGDGLGEGRTSPTDEENLWGREGRKEDDVDVVTKFLRIVESQHLLGENCTKGTDFHLGEGVVDRYAQERFRLEGEIAVNRANLYTRLWKYSPSQVLASEYLLHAEVLTMVELDEDIFAAGNCYDKFEYEDYLLYCPFAYRLPEGNILVKDLAVEYKYLSNTSEWFFIARKNAERAINNYTHLTKGYHTYTWNNTAHTARVEEEILSVTYDDGRWSKPYFDCGGGNIWMMTFTVPFFGYSNGSYYFKGTSGIDIDLRRVDIDQCPLPPGSTALNIFANSDKCKKKTTKCVTIPGLGFRRGSYRCDCKIGFYFPDTQAERKYYNGSVIEEEYEKKIMSEFSTYDEEGSFECLPCAEGCESCEDDSPCVVSLNWLMRTAILTLSIIIILCLPIVVFFTWKYGNVKVVRAASPALLRIILLGAFFLYSTTLVLYPIPSMVTCSLRVWLREVGFSLSYGALMLKTWRISVIFRVRSAKAVKITDLDLMKRLGIIVGVFAVFLAIRTVVAPPQVIVSMTADDLKAFLCSTDWWDHVFTAMEILFLAWGIRLCIMVRKAPSEFNESKFISMAIYNEFILSLFLNVSMLFLKSPADPDLLFIIFFCHTQLTITLLIALIFGSKVYLVIKGQGKGEDSLSMTKPMAAKFLQRSHANHLHSTSSDALDTQVRSIQEEFRRVYMQLEALKDKHQRNGNRQMVLRLTAMQQAANTTFPSTPTMPAPTPMTSAVVSEKNGNSKKDEKEKRGSKKEGRCSDGVVMKPYVNNILANVTDKIVCATFQEACMDPGEVRGGGGTLKEDEKVRKSKEVTGDSGERGVGGGGGEVCTLRRSKSREGTVDRRERRAGERRVGEGSGGGGSLETSMKQRRSLPASPTSPHPFQDTCSLTSEGPRHPLRSRDVSYTEGSSCSSPSGSSEAAPAPCRTPLQLGYRNAEFLLRKSISSELTERVCRSLEYLDEGSAMRQGSPMGLDEDQNEDRSVRSAHSTPRRSQGRRFREVRDPDRARAFILYSLSDRATLTDEVTV